MNIPEEPYTYNEYGVTSNYMTIQRVTMTYTGVQSACKLISQEWHIRRQEWRTKTKTQHRGEDWTEKSQTIMPYTSNFKKTLKQWWKHFRSTTNNAKWTSSKVQLASFTNSIIHTHILVEHNNR